MKIALCDDEKEVLRQLSDILKPMGHEVDCYQDPGKVIEKEYQVYFLDIGMDEMNGIEVGNALRKKYPGCCIIYLTNFDDYRSQAFGVHAFDYLKKPVNQEAIVKVLQDVQHYAQTHVQVCSFHTKEGILQLPVNDILYFEFLGRNVILHTLKDRYVMTKSLHQIYDRMKDYSFVMPHKSFCINLKNVKLVKGYDITMINGDLIPLSQKRSSEFRKELNDFLYEQIRGTSV